MPWKLKTRCNYPGCQESVRGRFCATHQRQAWKRPTKRANAAQRGYDATWEKVAKQRRELDHYLCQPCLKEQRLVAAVTVDHIVPVHVRPDWRLEIDNTQVICVVCHQQKTVEDTKRYGSSTQERLSDEQVREREAAQRLTVAPRAGE